MDPRFDPDFTTSETNPPSSSVKIDCKLVGCPLPTTATCTTDAVIQGNVGSTVVSGPIPTDGLLRVWPLTMDYQVPRPTACDGGPREPSEQLDADTTLERGLELKVTTSASSVTTGTGRSQSSSSKTQPTNVRPTATPKLHEGGWPGNPDAWPSKPKVSPEDEEASDKKKDEGEDEGRPTEIIAMPGRAAAEVRVCVVWLGIVWVAGVVLLL